MEATPQLAVIAFKSLSSSTNPTHPASSMKHHYLPIANKTVADFIVYRCEVDVLMAFHCSLSAYINQLVLSQSTIVPHIPDEFVYGNTFVLRVPVVRFASFVCLYARWRRLTSYTLDGCYVYLDDALHKLAHGCGYLLECACVDHYHDVRDGEQRHRSKILLECLVLVLVKRHFLHVHEHDMNTLMKRSRRAHDESVGNLREDDHFDIDTPSQFQQIGRFRLSE